MQLEDIVGRGNRPVGKWENGEFTRMAGFSPFAGR